MQTELIHHKVLTESEKKAVFNLWNNEYPEKLTYNSIKEFEIYLDGLNQKSHLLVVNSEGKVIGWYVQFKRDDEMWFVIILDSSYQGKGLGTQILEIAKRKEKELNGWVIDHDNDKKKNCEIYKSPLKFYLKNGFRALTSERIESDKISAVKIKWNDNPKSIFKF